MEAAEDLAAQLARLEREEASLLEARALASKSSLSQSVRDVERGLEGVRRALPELDVVAKTAGELRTSIRKTMERADVVSVKVRELDQSRSRALEALEYANRCVEARSCVKGAREALARKDLEVAAAHVKRFDDVSRKDILPGASEMQSVRAELERSILESHSHHHGAASTALADAGILASPGRASLREQASRENWLEAEALREALKQASVMSKVSDPAQAESRYAHFLASFLKERVGAEFDRVGLAAFESGQGGQAAAADDSHTFVDTLKYMFNSSAALIEANTRIPEMVLSKSARPVIFKCINSECDRQCTILFDALMAGRRLHERAGRQDVEKDLTKLHQLLLEICIAMQHVETYDRFIRSRPFFNSGEYNPEYRRIVQEVAGAYTLLEKKWIMESMKRARKVETSVNIVVAGRTLQSSSLIEDSFYVCRRAVKRALGTGSSEATCGCVNLVAACLEDVLVPFFSSTSTGAKSDETHHAQDPVLSLTLQINSLELCVEYCGKLFNQITSANDAFERQEDVVKVKSCAEGLMELSNRFEQKKMESISSLVQLLSGSTPVFRMALEAIEQSSFQLDESQFERAMDNDVLVTRLAAVAPAVTLMNSGAEGSLKEILSDPSFERFVELLSLRLSEEIEKGVVVKRFTQLGGLKLERDLRQVSESLIALVLNSLGIRAMFARLMQMASVLSIGALEEAHEVWDSFASSAMTVTTAVDVSKGIRPKDKLSAKEMKRVLALRIDFDQREIQRMKLL